MSDLSEGEGVGRLSSCDQKAKVMRGLLGVPAGRPGSPPSLECPRQDQDIVFLIDGSGSISDENFATMIKFVKAVMSQFQRPNTQVSSWERGASLLDTP